MSADPQTISILLLFHKFFCAAGVHSLFVPFCFPASAGCEDCFGVYAVQHFAFLH